MTSAAEHASLDAIADDAAEPTPATYPFPLSNAQLGIWNAQQIVPDVPLTISQYIEIDGPLDVQQLAAAVARASVELQSPVLRIVRGDEAVHQMIDPTRPIRTEYHDLRGRSDPRARAQEWMRRASEARMDPETGPLARSIVLRLGETEYFWYTIMHHIAIDGYGAMLVISRFIELYNAALTNTPPRPPITADLVAVYRAECEYRDSPQYLLDRSFWLGRTHRRSEGFTLANRTASPAVGRRIERGAFRLPDRKPYRKARSRAVIAALVGYCAAVTGESEVVLSLPVTARTTDALRRSVGFVSNVVPLSVPVARGATVGELTEAVSRELAQALAHQRYRHEEIRRDAGVEGGRGFFGPMVNLMLFHPLMRFGSSDGILHVLSTGPVEDLSVNIYNGAPGDQALHIDFEANPDRYTAAELATHHHRFLGYLYRFLAAAPETAVDALPAMDDAERTRVLQEWNTTQVPTPQATLPDGFARQVRRCGDAVAVTFAATSLTYRAFDEWTNRIARVLVTAGVGPETVVGVCMPRSLELVAGIYGVVKAGGAYLPLDPEDPADRVAYVIDSAKPVVVLTVSWHTPVLPEAAIRLELDTMAVDGVSAAPITDADRIARLCPQHPAYVIFTSGSTGRPKGVVVSHAAIDNRLRWMQHSYPIDGTDAVVQKTPAGFDVSVWELFWPLRVGARMVVATADGHRDPAYLAELFEREAVTIAHFVPSMLALFVTGPVATLRLRRVFCSGEALPVETVRAFRAECSARLHNLYGPTEAAVDVTLWQCRGDDTTTVPIGRPVWNTRVYVLDTCLRPVPVGVAGELYLEGVQLARGYTGASGLTAQRFVSNPFASGGTRLYRTGDLVRWHPHGYLEYLGRTDFQVKIRGRRIELGEIEAVLSADPAVAQAVCVARQAAHGGREPAAYVVAVEGRTPIPATLRADLRRMLPDYMVPHSVTVLDALPLTGNGKIDRRALPEPDAGEMIGLREPRTDTERRVLAIFADVLGNDEIGIDHSFFALGGDSLVAARAVARINTDLGASVSIRDVFEAPTTAQLAGRVLSGGTGERLEPVVQRPGEIPLSYAQHRLWLMNRFDPASAVFNMPFVIHLDPAPDDAVLRAALTDLLVRHETLRTVFPDTPTGPRADVRPAHTVSAQLPVYRTTSARLPHRLGEFASTGFDLVAQAPVRFALWRIDDAGRKTGRPAWALSVVVHHIACDGWSWQPLARDLTTALEARGMRRAPGWAPLPVQYTDFVLWQRRVLGEETDPDSLLSRGLGYWRETLVQLPEQLDVPTDRPRPRVLSSAGARHTFTLDPVTRRRIEDYAAEQGTSMFMVLHAALAVLLARMGAARDIAIGTATSGRGEAALDDLVGMFVNTVVLRTDIDPDAGFDTVLRQVRDVDLGAFAHADIPFDLVVEALDPQRSPSRHPLVQVMLSYERHIGVERLAVAGTQAVVEPIEQATTSFDLQVTVSETGVDELRIEFGYATDLFDADTIAAMGERWVRILDAALHRPHCPVGDLPILAEADAIALAPMPASPAEPPTLMVDLLTAAVAEASRRTAVVAGSRRVSYAALDRHSTRLARVLLEEAVGAEDTVAVVLPRSVESVVALWAVAKTGAAYLPIDPASPPARIAAMVGDAGGRLVLTGSREVAALPDGPQRLLLDSPELAARCAQVSSDPIGDTERLRAVHPDHPAYLIYTSGSTGIPKAVVVSHRGLASYTRELSDRFGLDRTGRILHFASPSFDASMFELLPAFSVGATVVVVGEGVYGGAELGRLLRRQRITHAFITPAALATVAADNLPDLAGIAVGGDECGPELVAAWAGPDGRRGRRMFNVYGPSEATVVATIGAPMRPDQPVTIGAAVRGVALSVLDGRFHPVPVGVTGELYLAGPGLARGYHARPGLTATRFVANPHGEPGNRMYRTGDLVTIEGRDRRGELRFIGRVDDQVKVRGYRIELAEIDAALRAHPGVEFARTFVHDRASDRAQLVSYVTTVTPPDGAEPVTESDVLALARTTLPDYMMPAAVVVLDRLPLTRSGKLDRDALPIPEFRTVAGGREPVTEPERRVAELFGRVLGAVSVGMDDNFFSLGGNSLLATRLAADLGAEFGVDIAVRSVFEAPTPAGVLMALGAASEPAPQPHRAQGASSARSVGVPLSYAQHRLWFLNRLDHAGAEIVQGEGAAYNIAMVLRIEGELDVDAMRGAFADLVERHEVLRTVYPDGDDGPTQVILEPAQVVSWLPVAAVADDEVAPRLSALAERGFDLTVDPPLRVELLRTGTRHYLLAMVIHHIAADGWSLSPLALDILTSYRARRAGGSPEWEPLPMQYADYSLRQRERLGDQSAPAPAAAMSLDYWRRRLADAAEELPLPRDHERPDVASYLGAAAPVDVSDTLVGRLQACAAEQGVSLFMVVHAAFAVALHAIGGARDVLIGTPVADRYEANLDKLIGMFANTVVLRTDVDPHRSFSEIVARSAEAVVEALGNSQVPFEWVVEALNPPRVMSRHPLFQVALTVQDTTIPSMHTAELDITPQRMDLEPAKFDLELRVGAVGNDRVRFDLCYSTDLFDPRTAAAMARRLGAVLQAVATDPNIIIGDIDVLTAAERRLLVPTRGPEADLPLPLPDYLRAAVAAHRSRAALRLPSMEGPTVELDYAELDVRSNQLARVLIRRGVGAEETVALGLRRGVTSVIALLAVVKTGAAFVPVDPSYPSERIRHMMADSGVRLGVAHAADVAALPGEVEWVAPSAGESLSGEPIRETERLRPVHLDNLAYVIYTSGSTGVPKGCAVTHRGLSNFAEELRRRHDVTADDRVLHFASPSFDASLLELLPAFAAGACLVVVPTDIVGGDELADLLEAEQVTHAFITPAALATMDSRRTPLPRLHRLIVGGEHCGPDVVGRWWPGASQRVVTDSGRRQSDRAMINGYGPTEASILATLSEPMTPHHPTMLGAPLRATSAVALDERLQPVVPGVCAELYIGGIGLARGYLDRPGLTAARFVANPYGKPGERLYRTGDLVRRNENAEMAYLGRGDGQVKIRGFRIELGEVTAAVADCPGIRFAHTEIRRDAAGQDRIVGYIALDVDAAGGDPAERVRAAVAGRLPGYMVPAAVMVLDSIPLSATGKLDRNALPQPVFGVGGSPGRAPGTPTERLMCEVIGEIVAGSADDGRTVTADDNFFDIGGNSLLATQLVSRIASITGVALGVRSVFAGPTAASLARLVDSSTASTGPAVPALVRYPRPARIPLSPAQRRLWLLNRLDTLATGLYNIPMVLRITGELDVAALNRALRDVVTRHETLRTVFPDSSEGPHQQVCTDIASTGIDLVVAGAEVGDRAEAVRVFAHKGFDLTAEPPFRAMVLPADRPDGEHLLVLVAHHIAMDGGSLRPLVTDLLGAYEHRVRGEAPNFDELPVQYVDYTLWQRDLLGDEDDPDSPAATQLAYWRNRLATAPEVIDLPTDRRRSTIPSYRGGEVTARIDKEVHAGLVELARRYDASVFIVLHTALAVLLHRLSTGDDICIGTAVAGRTAPELDRLVGMFVGTLVLRTRVSGGEPFTTLLTAVRDDDLDAFANADIGFERLVEVLNPARSASHHPLFQVMLSVPGAVDTDLCIAGLTVRADELDAQAAKFDLQFTLLETGDGVGGAGGIDLRLNYATDLFDEKTVELMAGRFVRLLGAVAADPACAVGDLTLLDPGEVAELSPVHGRDVGLAATFGDVLAAAMAVDPQAVALSAGVESLTYRELDRRTSRLARVLIGRGAGPEDFVALGLPRSIDSVVAMLAVTKTGAAFVPIDPTYPDTRKHHMLADSGATLGLTSSDYIEDLPTESDGRAAAVTWLLLDDPRLVEEMADAAAAPVRDDERAARLRLHHPAYLIYTSGSTGTPKGVTVTHGGLSNFASEAAERFEVGPTSRVLHFATPSFDAAVLDVLFALGGSARLVISPRDVYGGDRLRRLLIDEHVTHCFITTAALAGTASDGVRELTHLLVGGEACPPELVHRWAAADHAGDPGTEPAGERKLYNVYGPTETTIVATMGAHMTAEAPITIGGPIRGVSAMVLDSRLGPVPLGVTGELFLAGPGVARGYHRQPGPTAAKFVANPYGKPGQRMYRTADRVRWIDCDGALELQHIGRADHQVKIRGFRIEPAEVDAVLACDETVEFSITVGHRMPNGTTILVSYVKLRAGETDPDTEASTRLRGYLAAQLPGYMVPQSITLVDRLPLSPVGKVDRRALPEPTLGTPHVAQRPPETSMEAALCAAFADVLGVDSVGRDDNFFALGGNSLLATRVVAQVRERTGCEVGVQSMFVDATPAGIASRIVTEDGDVAETATAEALAPVLSLRSTGWTAPLFCVHPALGLSWCYTGLLRHLGPRRPVYGLQSLHVGDAAAPLDSLEQIATRYVTEMRRTQPEGPYHLLGWSLGGLIAHEMAVQLVGAGEQVNLLVMLDSYVLTGDETVAAPPDIGELLREFGGTLDLSDIDADDEISLARAVELIRSQSGPLAQLRRDHLERIYQGYARSGELAYRFEPSFFDGDLVFIRAAAGSDEAERSPDCWRAHVGGRIHEYVVNHRHSHLTTPEALAEIGPLVARFLEARPRRPKLHFPIGASMSPAVNGGGTITIRSAMKG